MKTALVYYSKTGHTDSIAKRFKDVDLLRVESESDNPNQKHVVLTVTPSIKDYGHLIFACPVHGFMVSQVFRAYLEQIQDLSNQTIDIFVTHQFRFSFLGGNQALKQMEKMIIKKNGQVRMKTSINWNSRKREEDISAMIDKYSQ